MGLAKFILMLLISLDIHERASNKPVPSISSSIQQSREIQGTSILPRLKNNSNVLKPASMHKNPAICNATVRKVKKTILEFSQLLVKKMTELVELKLNDSKESWNNNISLYWINNEIGETILNVKLFLPEEYDWLKSIDIHNIGYKEFMIPVELEESKRNATCFAELLKNVLKQLQFSDSKIICDVFNEKTVVCCKQIQHVEMCGVESTAIYSYEIHWSTWLGLIICLSLISHNSDRISAIFNNQIYREVSTPSGPTKLLCMRVPHNVILCKIMKLVCYRFIIPKLLFFAACSSFLSVGRTSLSGFVLITFMISIVWLAVALSSRPCTYFIKSDEEIQEEPQTKFEYLGKYFFLCIKLVIRFLLGWFFAFFNCVMIPSKTSIYVHILSTKTGLQIKWCENPNHGVKASCDCKVRWWPIKLVFCIFLVNVLFSYFIISSAQLVLIFFQHTLPGLLLNADYFFPSISFFTIVTTYIIKYFQSFCEVYSSLLINVNKVLLENNEIRDTWMVKEEKAQIWMVREDGYERVRNKIEPYWENISFVILKVVFIVSFAALVYECVDILMDHAQNSFSAKVLVLFGSTTLPYVLNICCWEPSQNVKEAAEQRRLKEIEGLFKQTI